MAGPWLLPIAGAVVGGGVAAAKGGKFGDIAKGALLGGATGGLASGVGTALGIGTTAASSGAQTAAAVLSPQEKLLQAAVGTSSASAAPSTIASAAPSALETAMKNVGYANTGANLISQLSGSNKPEEQTQFLQPSQPQMVAQIPPEDLYQQLLRMSQQG